ncbi:spore germination protein [Paenibacillus sepulcri]|uniref:Spore germination protein n=2 Tax=Paenibacillus sepulcri TaxID=359917 RepID=A0ABS7C2V7_9BACL|nr:spore germination protein [Paenibacillus sepulcri]
MNPVAFFEKKYTYSGVYAFLLINRIQILYYPLILPTYLIHPYMIWGIIGVGLISQFNLFLLSKWFSSEHSGLGYKGLVHLFGQGWLRLFAVIGLFLLIMKLSVITLGYVEILDTFIFPSMSSIWLTLSLLLVGFYIASYGLEKTIRFIVVVFLCSVWLIIVYIPFLLPPVAHLYDIYPLFPVDGIDSPWKSLLFIWSAFSGPEYLVCLSPWLKPQSRMLKSFTLANTLSIVEYLILFISSLFYFGSAYINKISYPILSMLRYLQYPVLERIDMFFITIHMLNFLFFISLFLLMIYGAGRISMGIHLKPTSRMGFILCSLALYACMIAAYKWLWRTESSLNIMIVFEICSSALSYLLVPSLLLIAIKLKKGRVPS